METKNNNYCLIPIDKYIEITNCDDTFDGTWKWDEDNGLEISNNGKVLNYFRFKIVDEQKFFLSKIKYGI